MFTIVIHMNNGQKSQPFDGMSLAEALQLKAWAIKHLPIAKKVRIAHYKPNK